MATTRLTTGAGRRTPSRLAAALLSLSLVAADAVPARLAALTFGAAVTLSADESQARSRSSSSGSSRSSSSSYSRPSASSSSSTRTPSYSGYTSSSSKSASDKAISRENSAKALDSYRRSQEPPAAPAASSSSRGSVPAAGGGRSSSSPSSYDWPDWLGKRPQKSYGSSSYGSQGYTAPRRPSADVYAPYRRYDPRWTPPAYALQGPRQFGIWDAAMLWFLLDTFSRPGHATFFHDNAADPGVQNWRSEAEKAAQNNPDLKTKLTALDGATAQLAGTPPRPGHAPEDVADKLIGPDDGDDDGQEEGGVVSLIIGLITLAVVIAALVGGLYVAFKIWRRVFRPAASASSSRPATSPATEGQTVFDLFSSGKDKARAPFRVGMTVTIDPTPFLLAGEAIKAKQPAASASGLTNIQGVGTLNSKALTLHRLYLTDADFLQIHLDKEGRPDECRLFHVIDEVDPADAAAWGQWLDKRDGMIGWRDFQTPDGKVYERAWSPGPPRIAPVKFHESEDSAKEGVTLTSYECMLYRAATDLAAPAPETEYLLVSAVEREGQAWVEIAAGVDINPASLSLT
jgi:hypothetical protein